MGQSEGQAKLPVEVAPTEGDVVAIGQAESLFWKRMPKRSKHARLADAWLADEGDILAGLGGVHEVIEQRTFARRQPQVGVVDLLAEGVRGQAEDGERLRAHWSSSESRRAAGARPRCTSSMVRVGSKSTRAGWGAS